MYINYITSGFYERIYVVIKYIYNFLRNHLHRGDSFVIETRNIFRTCGSCRREFLMLEEYLKSIGKNVKIIVHSDDEIIGTSILLEKLGLKK